VDRQFDAPTNIARQIKACHARGEWQPEEIRGMIQDNNEAVSQDQERS
jgi:hypothetical protein